MPQVVFARPSWSSAEQHSFCSMLLNRSVEQLSGTIYVKAVMDHKYDGIQLRDLSVMMVRRRQRTDDGDDDDVLRETVLQLPVNRVSVGHSERPPRLAIELELGLGPLSLKG